MKKILLFIILLIPINVYGSVIPKLSSDNVLIYDLTENKIILDFNSSEKTSIASLTKIMSVITAIESVENLEEEITITNYMLSGIYWNASRAGLKVGDKITYKDLLYASMLPSGADATNTLAVNISGNVKNYVIKMNELAHKIGMNNTNFVNVIGLDDPNQYSNAQDVLELLKYALKNEIFKEIYTTKSYTLTNGLKVESTVSKFNEKMNLDTQRILGSKTGFTDDAGYCLSSLINSNNHEVIIITLGAQRINDEYYHIIDTLNLINYVDEELENKEVLEQTTNEQIIIFNKKINNFKDFNYSNILIVVTSLLIFIVCLTYFCNGNKNKRKR